MIHRDDGAAAMRLDYAQNARQPGPAESEM